jgi:L-iditol 2-dehydrogenase
MNHFLNYPEYQLLIIYRLPDNVTYSEGALLEPLSVVMHGIKSAGVSLGRGAVICGAGPIGLIALAAARASGAHPLVITDLEPRRLEFAKKFVPTALTYQVQKNLDAQGNAQEIRKLFGTQEYVAPEVVLECTGVESSVITAAYTARRGGTVMVIGVGKEIMNNLPFMHLSLAEVCLLTLHLRRLLSVLLGLLTSRHWNADSCLDRSQIHQQI